MADESCTSVRDLPLLADCFDAVNVKLAKVGGPTRALDVLRQARTAGLQTMLGCMIESSVLISAAAHLAELTDYLDLDGNLLVSDDPYRGVSSISGVLSFADAPVHTGLCVAAR
jgi:L-alanine-DL-glutamate epimerase-like enolase superfamily enzyme